MVVKYGRLNLLLAATLALGAAACGDDDNMVVIPDGGGADRTIDASGRRCGNGIVEPPEQCDDGNQSNNDLCSTQCRTLIPPPASCDMPQIIQLNTVGIQDGFTTSYTGSLSGRASDIEPPAGCAMPYMGQGGIVNPGPAANVVHKFTLPFKADLLISTDNAGTMTDTVIYVVSACALGTATSAIACNDEATGAGPSEIFLTGRAAGDYFIVVDAFNEDAAMTPDYQLDVTVRPVLASTATCDTRRLLNRCDDNLACVPSAAGSTTGTCMAGSAPVITASSYLDLTMGDIRLIVDGTDSNGDVDGYRLELLNGTTPIPIRIDANAGEIVMGGTVTSLNLGFDTSLAGQTTFRGISNLPLNVNLATTVTAARITVVDLAGLTSAPSTATKMPIPTITNMTDPCDTTRVTNVCMTGLVCRGAPATCQTAVAPVLNTAVGLNLAAGARRLVLNVTDPDDDVTSVVMTFKNVGGTSVTVDANNNNTIDANEVSPLVTGFSQVSGTTTFSARRELPAFVFTNVMGATITNVDVQVRDSGMRLSNVINIPLANFTALPTPGAAASCDINRFADLCTPATLVCDGTCTDLAASQTAACTAATALTSGTAVTGTIAAGPDRWSGSCDGTAGSGGSENVYSITTTAVSDLVITTDFPETTIDTVLYLTSNCTAALTELGCADDIAQDNFSTNLTVNNVPMGTSFVVVDSFNTSGSGARTNGAGPYKLLLKTRTISAAGVACDPLGETSRCVAGQRCKPNATYTTFMCGT